MKTQRLARSMVPPSIPNPSVVKRIPRTSVGGAPRVLSLPVRFAAIRALLTSRAALIAIRVCLATLALPAVAGAVVTIAFDTYPGGAVVPPGPSIGDQWSSLGIIFADLAGGPVSASSNSCSLSPPNHAYAATIVATFVDPSTGALALTSYVGTAQDNCWVPSEGIAMRAYGLNGNLLGSIFNPPPAVNGNGHFEAFSFASAVIARVEMDCLGQGIDNFVFDTPTVVSVGDPPVDFAMGRLENPSFGGRLTVTFSLASSSPARLELLDVSGRCAVAREVGSLGPGQHQVRLEGYRPLASGVYFVRLSQGPKVTVTRVAILD